MTPDGMADEVRLRELVGDVARLRLELRKAEAARDREIARQANAGDVTHSTLGFRAGMTKQRVGQIVRDAAKWTPVRYSAGADHSNDPF